MSAGLAKDKKHSKLLESIEEIPEDLRQGIIDLNQQGIDAREKRMLVLKKKL